MAKITITETLDAGNDVLIVRANVEGVAETVEARGWLSAMTNHFDPDQYEELDVAVKDHAVAGLHLKKDATPREMTPDEKRAYCERLIAAVLPPQPVKLF